MQPKKDKDPKQRKISRQPGSQFWGTGIDLVEAREGFDPVKARNLIAGLGKRLFKNRYDYSKVEFRGLYLPIIVIERKTGKKIEVTPYNHLMSENGDGD